MKTFGIPLLLVGGGGYSLRNVARCWTYETSVALGVEIPNEIPEHMYSSYFKPEDKIHVQVSNMENHNNREYMEKHLKELLDNLKHVSATNVDHSNYRNSSGYPVHHMAFDEKENK